MRIPGAAQRPKGYPDLVVNESDYDIHFTDAEKSDGDSAFDLEFGSDSQDIVAEDLHALAHDDAHTNTHISTMLRISVVARLYRISSILASFRSCCIFSVSGQTRCAGLPGPTGDETGAGEGRGPPTTAEAAFTPIPPSPCGGRGSRR